MESYNTNSGHNSLTTTKGSIFFIGNATVLIKYGGFTILTDPTFIHMHEKVPLGYGLESARLTNPAIEINQLPLLDLVLLSHFHGDHFDQVAIRELDKSLSIVTNSHAVDELKIRGFTNTKKLDTWESITFSKKDNNSNSSNTVELRITATPGRHGPFPISMFLPKVMGSILDFKRKDDRTDNSNNNNNNTNQLFRIYITGDTTVFDDIKNIPKKYPDIDLALLHLGGTKIMGIMLTMDAKEGLEMFSIVNPKKAIPIHYNDYDVFKSPIEDFQTKVKEAGIEDRVFYLKHGETYTFEVNK
ncbi:MAG TPA: MBL fold metallo-hydrolase [Nitrososphaeraceae archaeon]|nr:MBL fold metallo-hydrolase [Nitrososphaeraceae archaeon]